MPELPEVETVRRGLERWVAGRRIAAVEVHHPRAIRRHLPGPEHFAAILTGRTILGVARRGKYLWLPLDSGDAVIGHLGMSGQLLLRPADAPAEKHLRVRFAFADDGPELRFVDQRTFGGMAVSPGGAELPREIDGFVLGVELARHDGFVRVYLPDSEVYNLDAGRVEPVEADRVPLRS